MKRDLFSKVRWVCVLAAVVCCLSLPANAAERVLLGEGFTATW